MCFLTDKVSAQNLTTLEVVSSDQSARRRYVRILQTFLELV